MVFILAWRIRNLSLWLMCKPFLSKQGRDEWLDFFPPLAEGKIGYICNMLIWPLNLIRQFGWSRSKWLSRQCVMMCCCIGDGQRSFTRTSLRKPGRNWWARAPPERQWFVPNTAPLEFRGGRRLPPVFRDIWEDFRWLFNRLLIFPIGFPCVNARRNRASPFF